MGKVLRCEIFGPPAGESKAFAKNESQSCKYAECLVVLTKLYQLESVGQTPTAAHRETKAGSGGSMVANLKPKRIGRRALPGMEPAAKLDSKWVLEMGSNIRRSLPLQCVVVLCHSKLCVFSLPVRVMETTEPSSSQALGLASP